MTDVNEALLEMIDLLKQRYSQTEEQGSKSFSPEYLEELYAMAFELYKNGKYEDAKAFFRFLTLADPFERKFWMGIAACNQLLKDYQEAINCYSAAALQDPSDPYAHWYAADCYFHAGNLPKAKEALQSALKTATESSHHQALLPKLEVQIEAWTKLPHGELK